MTQQELQQKMMGLSPENVQKFYDERAAFMQDYIYTGFIPENFDHYRVFCGTQTNEVALGVTAQTYLNLFFSKSIEQYSVGNMACICQASEMVNYSLYLQSYGPEVASVTSWGYMRQSFERLTKEVNAIVEPAVENILNAIVRKQQTMARLTHNTGDYKQNGKQISLK